jgi:hypothetical protein
MVKYGVPFEVRTELLNIIYTSFGLKWLNEWALWDAKVQT